MFLALIAAAASAKPLHIVQIIADDLGYNDLASANGNKTSTPAIDGLLHDGIRLDAYHTFKVCAPSRTSIMTGRYPWKTGYYDMTDDGNHCVDPRFTMLPQLLKGAGYATHAIGKWDVGSINKRCTPTDRGFDSFVGYYEACLEDYWYHFSPACHDATIGFLPVDLSKNTAADSAGGGHIGGLSGHNGTYHAHLFKNVAVGIIERHAATSGGSPLFLYLAPQNVHLGCGTGIPGTAKPHGPIQAPCGSVDLFGLTAGDTQKAQAANLLELDYVVGNVSAALHRASMWDQTVLVFASDNGGPLDHTTNAPLRGGKHTFWEGGVRVVGLVSGGALPPARRGVAYEGLLHSSDWLPTFVQGVAGAALPPNGTEPTAYDGVDAWQSLLSGGASPRVEVIHQVRNRHFNDSSTGYALRVGDFKLVVGDAGDHRILAWPEPSDTPTAFGTDGGVREPGTEHCRAPSGCSPGQCGTRSPCNPHCLFDVARDAAEAHDLCPGGTCANASHASTLRALLARLEEAGEEGPPTSLAYYYGDKTKEEKAMKLRCDNAKQTNFIEPVELPR